MVALHRAAPFTDVHAHPSLGRFLFGHDLWGSHQAEPGFRPQQLRSGFRQLEQGHVGVLWAAHYVPEDELLDDCSVPRTAVSLGVPLERLRAGDRFALLAEVMDGFEAEVARSPGCFEVARSLDDLARIRESGRTAVVHAVEGAHALGGDPGRLEVLAARGVACVGLAHLFANRMFSQTLGVPPELMTRFPCRFRFHADEDPPVSPLGYQVLEQLAVCRMLADVTHCSPRARAAVYAALAGRRPVIASHVGLQRFCRHPYNLDDEDLRAIAAGGGAVGLVLAPAWLRSDGGRTVLDALWRSFVHVRDVTGSWDHVMIGSDFDGFTDAPEDCWDAGGLWGITAMLLARGLDAADVIKVIGGNARRVLEAGWH